jgi:hypothetical protein
MGSGAKYSTTTSFVFNGDKSHAVSRLIVGTYLLMASHGDHSPRLILKAGCNEGCKAGIDEHGLSGLLAVGVYLAAKYHLNSFIYP